MRYELPPYLCDDDYLIFLTDDEGNRLVAIYNYRLKIGEIEVRAYLSMHLDDKRSLDEGVATLMIARDQLLDEGLIT